MKRCKACNTLCEDYEKICHHCGRKMDGNAGGRSAQTPYKGGSHGSSGSGYADAAYGNSYDHTREFTSKEISEGKALAIVTYLFGVTGILFGLLDRRSEYVRFHVRQNLKYLVINLMVGLCAVVLFLLVAGITIAVIIANSRYGIDPSPVFAEIGWFWILYGVYYIAILVMKIVCVVWVGKGKAIEAPLVRSMRFMK